MTIPRTSLPLLFALLATACAPETVERPPAAPMNWASFAIPVPPAATPGRATDKERAIAEAYLAALKSPGFSALGPMLDEFAKLAFDNAAAGAMMDARGRDKVVKAHDAIFGDFDQRKLAARRVLLTKESQAIEWVMTGVHARDFFGVAPTQKPVAIQGITLVWTKDDGAITEIHV